MCQVLLRWGRRECKGPSKSPVVTGREGGALSWLAGAKIVVWRDAPLAHFGSLCKTVTGSLKHSWFGAYSQNRRALLCGKLMFGYPNELAKEGT